MIIVNIMGGLGNQMFQYPLGKAISLEYKVSSWQINLTALVSGGKKHEDG